MSPVCRNCAHPIVWLTEGGHRFIPFTPVESEVGPYIIPGVGAFPVALYWVDRSGSVPAAHELPPVLYDAARALDVELAVKHFGVCADDPWTGGHGGYAE